MESAESSTPVTPIEETADYSSAVFKSESRSKPSKADSKSKKSLKVNTNSIAYYIDLKSPNGSVIKRKSSHERSKSETSAGKFTRVPTKVASKLEKNLKNLNKKQQILNLPNTTHKHNRTPTYPNSVSPIDTFPLRLEAEGVRAKKRRQDRINEKRTQLKITHLMIDQSNLIVKHKNKINAVKTQVKTDFAINSATLKRQMILQKQVEKNAMRVERAQGVALLNKIEKKFGLQRSYSSSFIEGRHSDNDSEEEFERIASIIQKDIADYQSGSENTFSPLKSATSPIRITTNFTQENADILQSPFKSALRTPDSDYDGFSSPIQNIQVALGSNRTPMSPAAMTLKSSMNQKLMTPVVETPSESLFVSSPRKTLLPQSLKRSQSVPLMVSLQHTINQMHMGLKTGIAVQILDLLPPITRYTLRELDFDEIVGNVQLRHDLAFDPNLQFKPNEEGAKGKSRTARNKDFWGKVDADLKAILSHPKDSDARRGSFSHYTKHPHFLTIPVLVNEIREILLELLPYSLAFHEELNERLDVDLINQQLENHVFQPIPFIEYIAHTLKQHCAPIRDEKIDEMVKTCKDGDFTQCLKMLFDILELMKLDIANYQLKKIRPHVVDNLVEYEREYFDQQLKMNVQSTQNTEAWLSAIVKNSDPFGFVKQSEQVEGLKKSFSNMNLGGIERSMSQLSINQNTIKRSASVPLLKTSSRRASNSSEDSDEETSPPGSPGPASNAQADHKGNLTDLYYRALLSLLSSPNVALGINVPETFHLDMSRLSSYYNEWQDLTILACLMILYRQAVGPKATPADTAAVKDELWILLNDPETTLPHISLHILNKAEKTRGTPYSDSERTTLSNLIDKTLSPESTLFELVQKRIALHLYTFLTLNKIFDEALRKHGMLEIKKEVEELAKKIMLVAEHNRIVYSKLYDEILKKLQQ